MSDTRTRTDGGDPLEALRRALDEVPKEVIDDFLRAFDRDPISLEEAKVVGEKRRAKKARDHSLDSAKKALADGNWAEAGQVYGDAATSAAAKAHIRGEMLASADGLNALAADPALAGAILSAADPRRLRKF